VTGVQTCALPIFRGAGLDVVWTSLLWLLVIGAVFFFVSLRRFRNTIARLA
jgi:ABC-2 type transport system permease protein